MDENNKVEQVLDGVLVLAIGIIVVVFAMNLILPDDQKYLIKIVLPFMVLFGFLVALKIISAKPLPILVKKEASYSEETAKGLEEDYAGSVLVDDFYDIHIGEKGIYRGSLDGKTQVSSVAFLWGIRKRTYPVDLRKSEFAVLQDIVWCSMFSLLENTSSPGKIPIEMWFFYIMVGLEDGSQVIFPVRKENQEKVYQLILEKAPWCLSGAKEEFIDKDIEELKEIRYYDWKD